MYCRKCYAKLEVTDGHHCPYCGTTFNPDNAGTYLSKPFLSKGKIISYILLTTIVSLAGAFVVAMFQLAGSSGH